MERPSLGPNTSRSYRKRKNAHEMHVGRCQQGHSINAGFCFEVDKYDIFSRTHGLLGKCVTTAHLQCSYALLLCCVTSSLLLCGIPSQKE